MIAPLISIIITVLNGEKTLSDCLSSVAMQTFTDYELVIVDGGSEDHTLEIINASNVHNKIVSVIPGIGLYAGLNVGINLSTGQWLYFIGADDELNSIYTLQMVSEAINNKVVDTKIIIGNVLFLKQQILFKPTFGAEPYWLRHELHHQGIFYDRSIFLNIAYNENMKIASDYELNLKLALIGTPYQYIDIVICNFGGDGISENQLNNRYKEMDEVYKRLFKGFDLLVVMAYFKLRRNIGKLLRSLDLINLRGSLKKIFG